MRKSDEQEERHYFRMGDRFFRVENQWFYTTREGNEGPFNAREEAEAHLRTFVAMQELTDEHGAYRFETEWPALRPPHVHFLVEAPGYRPLATQWVADRRVKEARFDLVLEPSPD